MQIDRTLRSAAAAFAAAAVITASTGAVYAEESAAVVPETGNIGISAYLVPAAIAAVAVVAKKKTK